MKYKVKQRARNYASLLVEKGELTGNDLIVACEYSMRNLVSNKTYSKMQKLVKSEKFKELLDSLINENKEKEIHEASIHAVYEVVKFAEILCDVLDSKPVSDRSLEIGARVLLSLNKVNINSKD